MKSARKNLRYLIVLSTVISFFLFAGMREADRHTRLPGSGSEDAGALQQDVSFIDQAAAINLNNPYKNVDWSRFGRYKANLHAHTLQSDGYHKVDAVIHAYHNAGYSILALTDHDWNWPNARITWGHVAVEDASPYPIGPLPRNYPANTTWPWKAYGGPAPEDLGMVGIQAGELTFRHHINSFFSDYGVWYERTGDKAPYGGIVDKDGNEIWEDDQLLNIRSKGGLAILNHPGISNEHSWWDRKSLHWYVERFKMHASDYLIGMEVANNTSETEKYDEGLWDQLLARFMPDRPIWGFGNDDMHTFQPNGEGDHEGSKNVFTVFLLDSLTTTAVRAAMEKGQFYFCKSSHQVNLQQDDFDIFPLIESIAVDEKSGTITIKASNYDRIRWISSPESLEPIADYATSNQPWPLGRIVHNGLSLNYRKTAGVKNYVRIELERTVDGHSYRTFTNPIGIAKAK